MASQEPTKIEISSRTIIFAVLFLLGLKLLWTLSGLIVSLFIAFIIMSIFKPLVTRLERYKIPRTLSALVIFALLIFAIGNLFSLLLPSLLSDMTSFIRTIVALVNNIPPPWDAYVNLDQAGRYIPNFTNQAFSIVRDLLSNVVFVITTLFFSFYFIVEENFIKKFLIRFFHEQQAISVAAVFDKIERRMSRWFWGELILMSVIGAMTFIGLSIIGVKHALTLAVIAGLLEVIPVVGPVISAIPALIFSINQSAFLALSTLALYIIIQQLENNLIVPTVMKRAVGLNKIIILIALIAGGKLGGFAGIFLAVPLTLFVETILTAYTKKSPTSVKQNA